MLIEFSVANFRSFQEMQTLRLQAAPIKSKNPQLDEQNVFQVTGKLGLVKSKVIFGANASGKSNLVKAMLAFFNIFQHSLQNEKILSVWVKPYLLDTLSFQKPTFFQIQFRTDGRNYRYGFEADEFIIRSEWLYSSDGKGQESYHFKRDKEGIKINSKNFKEGARLIGGKDEMPLIYRFNALFLPIVAAFNGPIAVKIKQYFLSHFIIYNGIDVSAKNIAMEAITNEVMGTKIATIMKQADLGIEDVGAVEMPEEGLSDVAKAHFQKRKDEGRQTFLVMTKRKRIDETGNAVIEVPFLMDDESYGTQKLFWLTPLLINALENGGTLVIDEFGSSLHVKLIRAILDLFHSQATNPHNAQLIVATHDTHLLDQRLFRRDQIAFVEKTRKGQSILTDLVEFKGVRNDASLENDYLQGRYGAIPLINQFDWAFTFENNGQEPHQEN